MNAKNNGWVNSALALTKTQTVQDYHVFAYITSKDLSIIEDENPILGSIIILASFCNRIDSNGGEISGKKEAIQYAKDLISISGYNLIFWTESHKWFDLKRRAKVGEIHYIDDKSGIENATNFIDHKLIEQEQEKAKFNEALEEEKKLHRARCNSDHVEHFVANLVNLNDAFKSKKEYEKKLEDAQMAYDEHLQKLRMHFKKHPNHEQDALELLKARMEGPDYLAIAYTYSQIKDNVSSPEDNDVETGYKIYEKKSTGDLSNNSSKLSEKASISDRIYGEGQESGQDKSYSDVVSGSSESWRVPPGNKNSKRKVRGNGRRK